MEPIRQMPWYKEAFLTSVFLTALGTIFLIGSLICIAAIALHPREFIARRKQFRHPGI